MLKKVFHTPLLMFLFFISLTEHFIPFFISEIKSFQIHAAHRTSTSLHCETTYMGLVYRVMCRFTPQLFLILSDTSYEGMTRMR